MAKYTVEVGSLIQNNFDLGLKDYPIYKEEFRKPLNDLLLEHYYFREIGLETPQLFKRFLNRKMMEIMPYYNQLFKSEDVKFNPLYNIELKEVFEQTRTSSNNTVGIGNVNNKTTGSENVINENTEIGNNSATSKNTNKGTNINVYDDTPQTMMTNEDILNNKFANKIEKNSNDIVADDTASQTTNTSNNGTTSNTSNNENIQKLDNNTTENSNLNDAYTRTTEGSSAGLSFSHAIQQWRDIMININMMIVEELEPLFMQVY